MKTKALLVIASALTVAAHGAALLEADGLGRQIVDRIALGCFVKSAGNP